jgi:glyoxylase-like metal-dependent hydrolase (beta-lactamase superfamily II)
MPTNKFLTLVTLTAAIAAPLALAQSAELRAVNAAADALGGKDRLLSIRTIKVEGYGQQAYQNGGGNPTGSIDAPQKWVNINGMIRTIDVEHNRMHTTQRMVQDFVFAYERNMTGVRQNQFLDGDLAWNVGPNGQPQRANEAAARQRRIELLNNPVVLVRTLLDSATKLSNLRTEAAAQVIDVVTAKGDKVSVAFDGETRLPKWISWVGPDSNLGDVTYRTSWVGWSLENGVKLPIGYNTTQDWRNVVWNKLYIDKYTVDGPSEDLAAPAAVRNAAVPAPPQPKAEVIPVAKGVWYLRTGGGNSTLFEFADHLTLFEAYGNEANAMANIAAARATVPSKPLTEVITSHHHFDHSGGLRAAVAEGLTVISARENQGIFQEMAARPATQFPDALGRSPKPLKFRPVDEQLTLKDSTMEVQIYRVRANNHMPAGIFAYVPSAKLVAEGDLVDEGWDIVWWGDSYTASVKYWKLDVEKDLPVHGNIHTWAEVVNYLKTQTKNAQNLCDRVEKAGLAMQGCPLTNEP